jgi:hypothetical protein
MMAMLTVVTQSIFGIRPEDYIAGLEFLSLQSSSKPLPSTRYQVQNRKVFKDKAKELSAARKKVIHAQTSVSAILFRFISFHFEPKAVFTHDLNILFIYCLFFCFCKIQKIRV